jgi:hypothetical protein
LPGADFARTKKHKPPAFVDALPHQRVLVLLGHPIQRVKKVDEINVARDFDRAMAAEGPMKDLPRAGSRFGPPPQVRRIGYWGRE